MRRQEGFSYVIVMFLVAALSLVAVRAIENSIMIERRDLEAELLWRGTAYREAIKQYHLGTPGSNQGYPHELKDLLSDQRLTRPTRPLRKLYRDPMTAAGQWAVVRNESGDVIGVHSLSTVKPIKRAGFPTELASFANAQHYSDWRFVYLPEQEKP